MDAHGRITIVVWRIKETVSMNASFPGSGNEWSHFIYCCPCTRQPRKHPKQPLKQTKQTPKQLKQPQKHPKQTWKHPKQPWKHPKQPRKHLKQPQMHPKQPRKHLKCSSKDHKAVGSNVLLCPVDQMLKETRVPPPFGLMDREIFIIVWADKQLESYIDSSRERQRRFFLLFGLCNNGHFSPKIDSRVCPNCFC